jgi:hypothetical protein
VQDARGKWYRAALMHSCFDLPYAEAIGFETGGMDRFDRFSSVVVRGQRCAISSLTRIDAPPRKARSS